MPSTLIRAISVGLALSAIAGLGTIHGLPLYTAREGRQCDSCHAYPFETDKQKAWVDPPLAQRKCNMSCQTCHVDPGGGGLRSVAGRYLARSTLPIFESESRPWHDRDRNITDLVNLLKKKPTGSKTEEPAPAPATAEAAKADKFRTHELPQNYSLYDPFVIGTPAGAMGGARPYAPEYGLYGKLNADPFIQFGGDLRLAYLKTNSKEAFFPMQADVGARIHPVEKISLVTTLGLVGRTDQLTTSQKRSLDEMYTVRNAYIMLHELPGQMYARVGFFQPVFGQRQEDHTAFVRQNFEMDLSKKYSSVMGAEIGLAANYPYINLSVFTNNGGQAIGDPGQSFVINPQGIGAALAAGWRDLAFGGGFSLMFKKRPVEYQGNLRAASVDSYFNLGRLALKVPLTVSGELAVGDYTENFSPRKFYASYVGLDYLVLNGLNLKINHHYSVSDLNRSGSATGRYGFGMEVIFVSWLKVLVEYRLVWTGSTSQNASFVNPLDNLSDKQWIIISHAYF